MTDRRKKSWSLTPPILGSWSCLMFTAKISGLYLSSFRWCYCYSHPHTHTHNLPTLRSKELKLKAKKELEHMLETAKTIKEEQAALHKARAEVFFKENLIACFLFFCRYLCCIDARHRNTMQPFSCEDLEDELDCIDQIVEVLTRFPISGINRKVRLINKRKWSTYSVCILKHFNPRRFS